MEEYRKKFFINKVMNNIIYLNINDDLYKLTHPTKEQKSLSFLVYNDVINNNKFNDFLTREQAKIILAKNNQWTDAHEKNYEDLSKYLEDLKIELYKSLYNEDKKKQLRKKINTISRSLNNQIIKKYSLDYMTLESHAETIQYEFLIATCIKDSNNNNVYTYDNFNKKDNFILQRFLNVLNDNILSSAEIREIVRTDPFRSLWSIGKESIFGIPACEISDDHKTLIMYSKMYDNVYESIDRPDEKVINDDDMLDGWFALQRRNSEKERKQKEVDSLLGKKDTGKGDLFVVVNNKEEAEAIYDLNNLDTNIKLKQREKALQKGRLQESQLPDVQMDLRSEAMRQMANKGK